MIRIIVTRQPNGEYLFTTTEHDFGHKVEPAKASKLEAQTLDDQTHGLFVELFRIEGVKKLGCNQQTLRVVHRNKVSWESVEQRVIDTIMARFGWDSEDLLPIVRPKARELVDA